MRYLIFFLICFLLMQPGWAASVSTIKIDGNERVEPTTIQTYLTVKQGETATAAELDNSLRALFQTGLFTDVALDQRGDTLTVHVSENPIINRIAFEGNDNIVEDKLTPEIQLKSRAIFTRAKVQADVERLQTLYNRKGYFGTVITPKIIKKDQNRVDLVFVINEGQISYIQRINFVGNQAFTAGELRDQLFSTENAWFNFLTDSDVYDPDRLNADQDKLRRFYNQNGYADFKTIQAMAELAPNRSGFYMTFTLDEGPRYKFGDIKIISEKKGLDEKNLRQYLTTKPGNWYNNDKVEDSINRVTSALNKQNYAFVQVDPDVRRNAEKCTIDIVYKLHDGPQIYVQKIDIHGNSRTEDRVVRRQIILAEGDPLNPAKLKQSEQKIKDLNYFKTVEVKVLPGDAPDRKVIDINLIEQSTGDLQVGAGYSTTDGPLVNFSIKERNFLGRGQELKFATIVSQRRQNYDVSFTEPYFLERNMSAGVDVFNTRTNSSQQSSYVSQQTGAGLRLGYPLSDNLRQTLGYRISQNTVSDVESDASIYIKAQRGDRLVSLVSQELTYDRRDSRLAPTSGYIVNLATDVAGLGGDAKYMRNVLTAANYWALNDDYILKALVEGGNIFEFEDKGININDRFFLGGETMRGFEIAGIGPRDVSTSSRDALGGQHYLRGTVELTVPLGLDDLGVKGALFTDAATLGDAGTNGFGVRDNDALRVAAGGGFSWKSPFGPIRVDIAQAIVKEDYDKTQLFRISFGTRF